MGSQWDLNCVPVVSISVRNCRFAGLFVCFFFYFIYPILAEKLVLSFQSRCQTGVYLVYKRIRCLSHLHLNLNSPTPPLSLSKILNYQINFIALSLSAKTPQLLHAKGAVNRVYHDGGATTVDGKGTVEPPDGRDFQPPVLKPQ